MVFFKNHKVRLEVSSSNFPRYDRNPNTGRDIASEINPRLARQSVFHSRHYPSRIILPIISTTAENANRN
jgi:predicted acyl esterase